MNAPKHSPSIKGYLLDMDGVLYHGMHALKDAPAFIQRIQDTPTRFITNNPIHPPKVITERLSLMGFTGIQHTQIITSAMATCLWLQQQKPNFQYFAIGAQGLHDELNHAGTFNAEQADFVVVGEGPGLDYEQLSIGIELILNKGAKLVGTNPDLTVDSMKDGKHQILPGGGALIAPFIAATQVQATIIGKPEPLLYEMALQDLGLKPEECLMIGDRPDTDIQGAAVLGMQTALVRTGRFSPGTPYPAGFHKPNWDVSSLTELSASLSL
ncbi:MAG: HAD-IIA family hydrolase [Methylococcales bacterium]|jgi:NagD protein|nr:HAD-IIA family hydrolase [Methylococcales bacterium]MBT7446034.1 HAD-IIA family hydrolase [Methylococcales bacterium]